MSCRGSKEAVIGGTLVLTVLGSLSLIGQAVDLSLGTWAVDVAKSKYEPGPPPKSEIVRFEVSANGGFKRTIDLVSADGQKTHTEVTFKYDGKEYLVKGAAQPTTLTWKQIDDRTTEHVQRVNGKVTVTNRRVISRDGRTATVTTTGTNAQGQNVHNTIIQAKQS